VLTGSENATLNHTQTRDLVTRILMKRNIQNYDYSLLGCDAVQFNRRVPTYLCCTTSQKTTISTQQKPDFTFLCLMFSATLRTFVRSQPNPHKNNVSEILHFPKFYAIFCGPFKTLNQGFIAYHSKNTKCQTKFKIQPHGTQTGSYIPYSANLP
jgi:hypothetical protein